MMKQRTVSASYIDTLLDAFASAGGSRLQLLEGAGLREAVLKQPDNRLPVETVTKIWVAAAQQSQDPHLGLKVGEHIRPGSFSVLGHLLMTAATLGEALEMATRYAALVGDGGRLQGETIEGGIGVHYDLIDQDIPYHDARIEAVIASLLAFARWITGRTIIPLGVTFAHSCMAGQDAYEDLFLIRPTFNGSENSVYFKHDDLALPLLQANPELSAVLGGHAQKILSRISTLPPFLQDFRDILRTSVGEDTLDLETIAQKLAMTPRSLQRKLAQSDSNFQDELSAVRCELAMEWLQGRQKSIGEIAFELGFSDPASFNRAFKRWTGKPPGKWLDEALSRVE